MNYRHAFHAGNFADALKHAALVLCLRHLRAKPAPFFVLDTHAGAGRYDLGAAEPARTGEWRQGIARLYDATDLPQALGPYVAAVRRANREGPLGAYPGSPKLVRAFLRAQDRLVAVELHPEDATALRRAFAGDRLAEVRRMDGYQALKALLPPPIRRGLVLVDPAFEAEGEFARLARGLAQAYRRWAGAVFVAWYPCKDMAAVARFHDGVAASGIRKVLRVELDVAAPAAGGPLASCGLLIVNPPHTLARDLAEALAYLALALGDEHGGWRLDWLVPEEVKAAAPP